jgi:hypothetical protein
MRPSAGILELEEEYVFNALVCIPCRGDFLPHRDFFGLSEALLRKERFEGAPAGVVRGPKLSVKDSLLFDQGEGFC